MGDFRRERWLEEEISRLRDKKIKALQDSRTVSGKAKADLVDQFLLDHKEQEKLESELETLQDEL